MTVRKTKKRKAAAAKTRRPATSKKKKVRRRDTGVDPAVVKRVQKRAHKILAQDDYVEISPRKNGRPSSYKPEFAEQARKLCELGATDAELADFFEVSTRTVSQWKVLHADFLQALKTGKDVADDRVERSLFQRANGYSYDAVKIFLPKDSREPVYAHYREHAPPDVTACIFWLKNRRRDDWRDAQEHKHSGQVTLDMLVSASMNKGASHGSPAGDGGAADAPADQARADLGDGAATGKGARDGN